MNWMVTVTCTINNPLLKPWKLCYRPAKFLMKMMKPCALVAFHMFNTVRMFKENSIMKDQNFFLFIVYSFDHNSLKCTCMKYYAMKLLYENEKWNLIIPMDMLLHPKCFGPNHRAAIHLPDLQINSLHINALVLKCWTKLINEHLHDTYISLP